MSGAISPPKMGDPYLLTPGPLTTSAKTKEVMLRDWGSWDGEFRSITAEMRAGLLELTGDTEGLLDCVPMQGSGSFSVEAMLASFIPCDGNALVLSNGAYGKRIAKTLEYLNRARTVIDKGDYMPPCGPEVTAAIEADPSITHVVVVRCETSSGILNPIKEIADAVEALGRKLLVDSMNAFGAIPLDINEVPYAAMISSANKCIEGVPGFNFVEALHAHKAEGGVAGRGACYARNRDVMVAGMRELGFETLLNDRWHSPIIVTYFYPANKTFSFDAFYEKMKSKGFIIYPGKLTVVDSFRIGCIGQMDENVMRDVVTAAKETLTEMGVDSAAPPPEEIIERNKLT